MAQTTTLSTSTSGPQTPVARATQLNAILAALFSQNSGTTAPTATVAFMDWFDTSADPVVWKIRNAANDAWINFATISSAGVVAFLLGAGTVTQTMLADLAVSTGKIANAAVTSDKLGSASVTEAKIGTAAVTENKIGSGAVTSDKIGANAVGTSKLAVTGVSAGSYTNVNLTVGVDGRITSISNGSAGGWALLQSFNETDQASVILDSIANTVHDLMITFDLLPASSGQTLRFRARKASGTDITSYYWSKPPAAVTSGAGSGWSTFAEVSAAMAPRADNGEPVIGNSIRNDATDGGISGVLFLFGLQSGRHKRGVFQAAHYAGSNNWMRHEERGSFQVRDTAALTGVKLNFSSGNLTGRVAVFGRA